MSEKIEERVNLHHKVLFGDPENMKASPGIVSEQMRTNEILTELRDVVRRINWMFIAAIITTIVSVIVKAK